MLARFIQSIVPQFLCGVVALQCSRCNSRLQTDYVQNVKPFIRKRLNCLEY